MKIDDFNEYVKLCASPNNSTGKQWVGEGNPFGDIIIIGQEPAYLMNNPEDNIKEAEGLEEGELLHWKNFEYSDLPKRGNVTWKVYQKLFKYIFGNTHYKHGSNCIDFGNYVFVTDMNSTPSEKQHKPDKEVLLDRLKVFKQSKFIQSFPVVILACGNYIVNNDKTRQIDDTFGVEYIPSESELNFWVHYNKDKTRLVIHTRQLSGAISDDFLECMAKKIREFLGI